MLSLYFLIPFIFYVDIISVLAVTKLLQNMYLDPLYPFILLTT